MNMEVVNKELSVGSIRIIGVASASVVLIGDTEIVTLSASADTPPEAVAVGPLVPLAAVD
jgi:spore germination protein PD